MSFFDGSCPLRKGGGKTCPGNACLKMFFLYGRLPLQKQCIICTISVIFGITKTVSANLLAFRTYVCLWVSNDDDDNAGGG